MERNGSSARQLTKEAADLLVDIRQNPGGGASERLDAWILRSDEHLDAFLRATCALQQYAEAAEKIERRADLRSVANDNDPADNNTPSVWTWKRAALGLGVVVACVLVGVQVFLARKSEAEVVRYDQPGTYNLDVNSTLQLKEGYVESRDHGHEVQLLSGEAVFAGMHDATHPLRVIAGSLVLDATGTEFDVMRRGEFSQVVVVSGHVEAAVRCEAGHRRSISKDVTSPGRVKLTRDQTVTVTQRDCPSSLEVVYQERQQTMEVVDWTKQSVWFADTSVEEAVARFNEHNGLKMIVADPELAKRHIGGNFRLTDPDSFVEALQHAYDVKVTRGKAKDGSPIIYLRSRPGT